MSESSVRGLIARALSAQTTCDGEPHPSELHYRQTDAVLAVLADLPYEVVERAARALFEDPISSGSYTWAEMAQGDESRAELWRDDARRILKAVFGGEQA